MAQVSYLSMFSSKDLGDKGQGLEKLDKRALAGSLPRVSVSRKATSPLTSPAHKDSRSTKRSECPRLTGARQTGLLLARSKDALRARQRTTTWPGEYYRIWLDVSNLPVPSSSSGNQLQEQTPRVRTANWLGSLTRANETKERIAGGHSMGRGRHISRLNPPQPINRSSDAHLPPLAPTMTHHFSNDTYGNVWPRASHTVSRMQQNSLQACITQHPSHRDQPNGVLVWRHVTQPMPVLQLKTLGRNPSSELHRHSHKRAVTASPVSVVAERQSDVSPPPSPPHLSLACRVVRYVSTTMHSK